MKYYIWFSCGQLQRPISAVQLLHNHRQHNTTHNSNSGYNITAQHEKDNIFFFPTKRLKQPSTSSQSALTQCGENKGQRCETDHLQQTDGNSPPSYSSKKIKVEIHLWLIVRFSCQCSPKAGAILLCPRMLLGKWSLSTLEVEEEVKTAGSKQKGSDRFSK